MASVEPPPLDFDDGDVNGESSNDENIFSPTPRSFINSSDEDKKPLEEIRLKNDCHDQNNYKPPPGFKQVDYATHVTPLDYNVEVDYKPLTEGSDGEIEIFVSDPKRVGENMTAYISYRVTTKTNMPTFTRKEMEVYRRFSDFFALYEKLFEKHAMEGRFVPPPPEKSIVGMAKVKVSKDNASSTQFVERRRKLLERFLRRIAEHPCLKNDPCFVDFLGTEDTSIRPATNKMGLSGAAVLRLFNRVGDSFNKVTYKMEETDEWFEKKEIDLNTMEESLQSIGWCLENMIYHKKDLLQNLIRTSMSLSCLSPIEEDAGLARVLSKLSETFEGINSSCDEYMDEGCSALLEFIRECHGTVNSIKETMSMRVKLHKIWKDNEVTLAKKRENKVRMELAYKTGKLAESTRDIAEWENIVEISRVNFEKTSRNIKEEMSRFDNLSVKDFKEALISYLESSLLLQQKVVKLWEVYLPEAQSHE